MINKNSSRDEVLAAVKEDGRALMYSSYPLSADKEVVLEAVKQDGDALNYASENLRADKEVVLAAVKRYGWALLHASEDLRKDKEVVLEAVKQDGYALGCALGDLRHHPLLKSIAEETKLGNKQYISYKLFCFAEKTPEICFVNLYFLTSKEIRSACNSQNVVSSGNTHQFVFNFAQHQLGSLQDENDSQRCKSKSTLFSLCVIS